LLPDSGYFVSRTQAGDHLLFDAGPHGFLNGGHAHSDALSVVLTVGGVPLLVDCGTGTYTMDAATRDRFRSTRMHNSLVLDGRDHATPSGPFHWATRGDARFLVARTGAEMDFAVGTHDAYAPARHMRAVLALHGTGWLIVDRILSERQTAAQASWHLHPAWQAAVRGKGSVELRHASGQRLALATTAPELSSAEEPEMCAYSPEYGRIERSTTLVARQTGAGSFTIATFIPATAAGSDALSIAQVGTSSFEVSTGHDVLHVGIEFAEPEAQLSDWPQPCITRRETSRIP
jgi:hypothetical protein